MISFIWVSKLTVYLDVLLFINLYINFLLLRLTSRLTDTPRGFWRILLGAGAGSFFSLWMLLPQVHFIVTAIVKAAMAAAIIFATFGRQRADKFVRLVAVFYLSSYIFAGAMFGIWLAVKPSGMLINNSVVYFNISPLLLIITSALCYAIVWLISAVSRRLFAPQPRSCSINIAYGGRTVELSALVDTGNSLRDAFSDRPIVIIDGRAAQVLLTEQVPALTADGEVPKGFRVVPYSVVGGGGLMPVFRPDLITAEVDGRTKPLDALVGISSEPLADRYGAIVGSAVLE